MTKTEMQRPIDRHLLNIVRNYDMAIDLKGKVRYTAYAMLRTRKDACYIIGWQTEVEKEQGAIPYFVPINECGAVKHFDKFTDAWEMAWLLDNYAKTEELHLITLDYMVGFADIPNGNYLEKGNGSLPIK